MSSSEDAPLLIGGSFLKDRWEVLRKIGRGGFGEIYKAKDHNTGERCAVKVESATSSKQVLKMEVVVLKRLQSCSPHICVLLGCGRTDRINYIVMTLLGPNLSELRKQQPKQKFSLSTTLRVGVQVISALRAMHNCGFLHRDIKPSNFAIGASSVTKQTCYMLDFGLARQFKTSTGEIRPPRPVAGFRGTVRYASINAHQSKELGRHDDLWSVFYLLVELANGELPWKKIRDKEKAGKLKQSYEHKKLLKHLPAEFYDFLDHLRSLDYFQEPNYVMLSTLLQNAIRYLGIKWSDPLDWEQDHSVQSLTTMSAGSAPALQTNNKALRGKDGADGDSRTHVPTDDECLSQNAVKNGGENKGKEHFSNDENGRIRPLGTAKSGSTVQSKHTKGNNAVNKLQPRRSMPPSPLLQATHLINNDSGSVHAESLDRFFDMKVGDGRSCSLSGKSSSKSQRKQIHVLDKEENKTRKSEKSQRKSRSKSKSPTSSSDSRSRHQVASLKAEATNDKRNVGKIQPLLPPAAGKANNIQTGEAPRKMELSDQSPSQGENIAIHPDFTSAPQLGYTTEPPTAPFPCTNTAQETVQVEEHQVISGEYPTHNKLPTDVAATTTKEMHVALGNEGGMRRTEDESEDAGWDRSSKGRRENKEDGMNDVVEEKSREESLSESSGLQHRLFACRIQGEGEQVKNAEILPLETMHNVSRGHGRYSPGPPPLEFNTDRPQEMWGHDSTQPMSLTHELTQQTTQGEKMNKLPQILPRPPDHPPPKHYTLLAARRRRFRRPGKT